MTSQQRVADQQDFNESTTKERERKHRIMDTSAIVHDPVILTAYGDDHIYISISVLEELDDLKDRRDKAVSQEARKAIRELEKIIDGHDALALQKGIPLPTGKGFMHIMIDTEIELDKRLALGVGNDVDNRLINASLFLQKNVREKVILVSRDINLRLKARTLGVGAEDVPDDIQLSDLDLLWPGYVAIKGDLFASLDDSSGFSLETREQGKGATIYKLPKALFGSGVQRGLYWSDETGQFGRVLAVESELATVELLHGLQRKKAWGIQPRNIKQAIALHQITDDAYDLNMLLGPAGTGKTLLAMAAALHMVLEEKRYKRIICVRSRDLMDDDVGYLPGDLTQKSTPMLAGMLDAIYTLHREDENSTSSTEYIIERAQIEFTSMAYMRGRSIADAVIIVDEAQNMTRQQMRGMLSRAGVNSRMIVLGNLRQIDNPFLTPLTSALASAVNVYKNYERGSVLIMNEVERSPLAAFTEEYF